MEILRVSWELNLCLQSQSDKEMNPHRKVFFFVEYICQILNVTKSKCAIWNLEKSKRSFVTATHFLSFTSCKILEGEFKGTREKEMIAESYFQFKNTCKTVQNYWLIWKIRSRYYTKGSIISTYQMFCSFTFFHLWSKCSFLVYNWH